MKPLVSIITPVYNAEKYLEETILSVINQSYKNWELLLIDDCSTDKSYGIIQKYLKVDNRIKCLKNEKNNGPFLEITFLIVLIVIIISSQSDQFLM